MSDPIADYGSLQTPYSQEAEEAVIGAVVVEPSTFIILAAFLVADDFFILRHRYIWAAINRLMDRSEPVDYLTLCAELKACGQLGEIGGPVYITQLINSTPNTAHAEAYGLLVQKASIRRRMMAAADEIKAMAQDDTKAADDLLADASRSILQIQVSTQSDNEVTFFDSVSEYFDLVERMMNDPKLIVGLSTGFREIDRLLQGLQSPDLIILAGRPGMGKSSFLLSMLINILRDLSRRAALFTLEMSTAQITQRAVSLEAGINLQRLQAGQLNADEWKRFVKETGNVSRYNLLIDDRAKITPAQMRAKLYRWIAQHGKLDVVCVDYLQLMSGGKDFKADNRVQELGYITGELKQMCKEFNVPIVAAAQLSRKVEERADKRPMLHDLRESGTIEQDADIVGFLYRDEVYNEATEFPNQAEMIWAKHRNGPTGTTILYFEKTLTKFMNSVERNIDLVNGVMS